MHSKLGAVPQTLSVLFAVLDVKQNTKYHSLVLIFINYYRLIDF